MRKISPQAVDSPDTFVPDQEEIGTLQQLAAMLTNVEGDEGAYFLVDSKNGVKSRLPRDIYKILLKVIIDMSQGRAVSVSPVSMRLTTQQAADFLGVSRPTLVRLLDEGQISYTRPRRHRLVRLDDLLDYYHRQQHQAARALDEIMEDTARAGFYDQEFTEA